jgi:two-component sensor histidine kinase
VPHVQAAATDRETRVERGGEERDRPESDCDLRQLRHHTKNVLQQILLQMELAHELQGTEPGRRLVADLKRRVVLSGQISDALFGITRSPALMSERLRALSESMVQMLADGTQVIHLDVAVAGDCPDSLRQLVLRVAHEFISNAVKHGMHTRVVGTISVHLLTGIDGCTALVVTDDGWGFNGCPDTGEGLKIAGDLAAAAGGTISLLRTHVTVAELALPSPQVQHRFGDRSMGSEFGAYAVRRNGTRCAPDLPA